MTTAPAGDGGLHRGLTSRQVTMIALGGAIGTGLFLGSDLAISKAGPSVVLAYVACGLIALVISFALAEMVVVHPDAGSFGAIAHRYLGPWAGFVIRWTYWAIQAIAVGGEMVAAGIYVQVWWPQLPLWLPVVAFSALMLGVNAITVRLFGEIEYWFSMIKVTAISVFVLVGLAYIVFGLPGHAATGTHNLTAHGGFLPHGVSGLGLAFVFVIFSFIGTEVVAVTAAEAKDPVRDIPRAARRMVLRLALFYVAAMAVVVTIVPWDRITGGDDVSSSPFVRLFDIAGLPAAAGIMNFVVLTAALSSANANIYLTARMLHSLGLHGMAPRRLGRVSGSGVPRLALAVSTIGLAIATVLSAVSADTAYVILFGVSVFGALIVWIMILATHAAFRRRRQADGLPPSPVRLWAAPVTVPVTALALAAILISTAFIDGLTTAWKAGIPFLLLLTAAYLLTTRRRSTAPTKEPTPHP